MSLAEEIKRVLLENPQILVEVLTAKPEIIYQVLAKLMPWQNLATKQDIEELKKVMATKQDIEELRKTMATKEELEELRKTMATKDDLKNLATKEELEGLRRDVEELRKRVDDIESRMATKEDIKRLEERINNIENRMATKDDLKALEKRMMTYITGIGARWGVMNEEAFRNGVTELLRDAGYEVRKELLYDRDGYVYGEPSEVDIDVVVKDGRRIMVEITSTLKRNDIDVVARKREFYEKTRNEKIDEVIIITTTIDDKNPDRVKAKAQTQGIKIITPTDIQ